MQWRQAKSFFNIIILLNVSHPLSFKTAKSQTTDKNRESPGTGGTCAPNFVQLPDILHSSSWNLLRQCRVSIPFNGIQNCVCRPRNDIFAPGLNRSTDSDAIWQVHLWGPMTHCVREWSQAPQGKDTLRSNPPPLPTLAIANCCCHLANGKETLRGLAKAITPLDVFTVDTLCKTYYGWLAAGCTWLKYVANATHVDCKLTVSLKDGVKHYTASVIFVQENKRKRKLLITKNSKFINWKLKRYQKEKKYWTRNKQNAKTEKKKRKNTGKCCSCSITCRVVVSPSSSSYIRLIQLTYATSTKD